MRRRAAPRTVDEIRVEQQSAGGEERGGCAVDGRMLLRAANVVQRLRRDHRLRDAFDRIWPGVLAEIGQAQGCSVAVRIEALLRHIQHRCREVEPLVGHGRVVVEEELGEQARPAGLVPRRGPRRRSASADAGEPGCDERRCDGSGCRPSRPMPRRTRRCGSCADTRRRRLPRSFLPPRRTLRSPRRASTQAASHSRPRHLRRRPNPGSATSRPSSP